jgi:hypothetical protein
MGPDPCDGKEPSKVGADESSSSVSLDVGEKGVLIMKFSKH